MSDKLIPLEEAAKMLGLSIDKLTELRSQNEIFGYRDGASWKFKRSEIERVADELGLSFNAGADEDDLSSDGSLIADVKPPSAGTSDIGLGDELKLAGSDIGLGDEPLMGGGSNVLDGSGKQKGPDDTGSDRGGSHVLSGEEPTGDSPSDTGKMIDGDELLLAEDDLFVEDELKLEENSDEISLSPDSDFDSDFDDSDVLITNDSDSSAEISLDAADSGINLMPTDSGLSLEEEPLEMGGSDIDSLELPEDDDDLITLEEPDLEDSSEELMPEDDFMLTPVEGDADDESSGSQVIALEDSEIYADDSSSGLVAADDSFDSEIDSAAIDFAEPSAVPAQGGGIDLNKPGEAMDPVFEDPGFGGGYEEPAMAPVGGAAAAGAAAAPAIPESPYSIFNILALMCVAGILAPAGIVAADVVTQIWNFDSEGSMSSNLMSFFIDMIGWG